MARLKNLIKGTGEVIKEAGSLVYRTGKGYVNMYKGLFNLGISIASGVEKIAEAQGKTLESLSKDFYKQGLKAALYIYASVEAMEDEENKKTYDKMKRDYQRAYMKEFLKRTGYRQGGTQ